jgi:GNAT superfamily N-acetyltransferase
MVVRRKVSICGGKMADTSAIAVRSLTEADSDSWRFLWDGYLAFYEASVPEEITQSTWLRLLDGTTMIGRVAEREGRVLGFSASVLHEGTWTSAPICYLEDLFVNPDARGGGIGGALIEDLIQLGRQRGWSRLYWHTRADNVAARRLYDGFVQADGFVRYRFILS